MKVKDISYIAIMAVIITICSWISIPFTIPFTMQTFAIFSSLLILGGKNGTISILLYLLLGILGLPVFSGFSCGVSHLLGATGGFLFGFIVMGIIYMIFEKFMTINTKTQILILCLGLITCYTIGILWFSIYSGNSYSIKSLMLLLILPYIIPDLIKMFLAFLVSNKVKITME